MPMAVNAGDALAVLAMQPLRDGTPLSTRLSNRVADEFLDMVTRTVEGQAMELGWRAANVIDLAPIDYLTMIGYKTCWYTTVWPLRVGALIGSAGTAPLEPMTRFGFYLGAAFQIRDDLLNLVGAADRYGKELLGDIREGKRTLMVIHLLASVPPSDREVVAAFLARTQCPQAVSDDDAQKLDQDAQWVLDLMLRHGSVQFAAEFGEGVAAAAYGSFREAFADVPASAHRDFVEAIIPYMLARTA
jgi:geranylgeranyl diphosphate synthase type II